MTRERNTAENRDRRDKLLLGTLALFLYPLIAGLFIRSEPVAFLRYSLLAGILNVWNPVLVMLILAAERAGRIVEQQLGCLLLILTTYVIPLDDALQQLSVMWMILPLIRILAACAIIRAVFHRFRRTGRSGPFLTIGSLVLFSSVVDVALLLWIEFAAPRNLAAVSQFRRDYDFDAVGADDMILIGDSFVWGYGVGEEESFGAVMQRLYAKDGRTAKVYSLGMQGAGMKEYVEFLHRVPETRSADRIIVAFFLNDIPPRSLTLRSIHAAFFLPAIGRGCPTLRLAGEALLNTFSFSADDYIQDVRDDYRPEDKSFAARWDTLAANLKRFKELSDVRSENRPVFVILPLMVPDFDQYPAHDVHRKLSGLARELGFDVLDLLPAFQQSIDDGLQHRVSEDDIHFDAFVHELTARTIKEHCDR